MTQDEKTQAEKTAASLAAVKADAEYMISWADSLLEAVRTIRDSAAAAAGPRGVRAQDVTDMRSARTAITGDLAVLRLKAPELAGQITALDLLVSPDRETAKS